MTQAPGEAPELGADAELVDDAPVTYSVFATFGVNTDSDYAEVAAADEAVSALKQFEALLEEFREEGVEVRGIYDLTLGSFVDPAVCLWLRGPVADDLQWAYRQLLRVFSRYFATAPVSADLTVELTELEPEAGAWISFVDAFGTPAEQGGRHAEPHIQPIAEGDLDDEADDEGFGDEDAAADVSLHARVGVGIDAYTVVAEADEPQWLLGDPTEPFGEGIAVAGTPLTGRWINSSEVFEVLR
ncbi:hypothetical protein [Gulosibacter faecalis]|jgi:hypothetical protein|uniref:Uncharacterized protein n=1 Tax=Gulosibacter faecalis TaxID=272240 RepID=A0ABW5UWT2_9MICO|nr:hypothetical protein [Gulosibacter faecalis]